LCRVKPRSPSDCLILKIRMNLGIWDPAVIIPRVYQHNVISLLAMSC
jgi:hypothetical protein